MHTLLRSFSAPLYEGEGAGGGGSAGLVGVGDKGGAGGDAKPWFDGFKTPEVKAFMVTKNYADPEALGTAYMNLQRLHDGAKDVIAVPGDKATDEDWGKVFTALGRPETPDKYDIKFAEGMTVDEPFVGFAKGLFHTMGLSPAMAQKAADKWQGYVKERMDAAVAEQKTKATQAIETLKTTWGKDWDTHVAAGQKAVKGLGLSDAELGALDQAVGLPAVMKLLAAVGKGIGREDVTIINSGGGSLKGVDTPEQARAEIDKLQTDKAFQDVLFDPKHAEHKVKKELWDRLFEAAYPRVKAA